MEKIVFFGDSYTYGHGLSDCFVEGESGPVPSKLGWASQLCNMRNAYCRNLSISGASNLEILWTMLNTTIDPDEIIIVQWTFWNRDCLFDDKILKIHPRWEYAIPYYRLHSNFDMINRNYLNIHHGLLWLQQRSNTYLMLGNEPNAERSVSNKKWTGDFNNLSDSEKYRVKLTDNMIPYFFDEFWEDLADDNDHAGPKSNTRWAETVNKILDSKLKG